MENQIIGVKFLHTQDYQDLLSAPSLISLTAGKIYAYISVGFSVNVDDIVIVPNSGYNDSPVVPALVTNLDYQSGLNYATKPILAVIPKNSLQRQEDQSVDFYHELLKRQNIAKELNDTYEQTVRMHKIQKMAKKDPEIAELLQKLEKQDALLDQLTRVYSPTTCEFDEEDNE